MPKSFLIRGARQLLTLHGPSGPRRGDSLQDLSIIEDGSVLVSNGIITNVGPTRRIENLAAARGAEEINAAGRVVMPGFVDGHTLLIAPPPARVKGYSLTGRSTQSLPPDRPSEIPVALDYIRSSPAKALESQARRTVAALLRHGSTTMAVQSGSGLNESLETKCLRVINALQPCITVVPTYVGRFSHWSDVSDDPEVYAQWTCDFLLPKLRARRLARFAEILSPAAGDSLRQARRFLLSARAAGLMPKIQDDPTRHTSCVPLAIECEAVSVDGLNYVEDSEIELLARSRTVATLFPGNICGGLYSPCPPARKLIDSGVTVALASSYDPGASSTYNMQMVVSLACSQLKMTPEEAIAAATINSAHSLLEGAHCGSLEFDKRADILMLNISDYREIAFHFGVNQVALVMRAGEVIYQEGIASCSGEL